MQEDLIDSSLEPEDAFKQYVRTLDELGIENGKEKVKKMIFVDMILANSDRHKQNFGVIRNIDNLKYIDIAPIYDTGRSMATDYPSIDKYQENYCLFNKINASRKECLELISGLVLRKEQVDEIRKLPLKFDNVVKENFLYTNLGVMKEDTLDNLCEFLKKNIEETLSYVEIK